MDETIKRLIIGSVLLGVGKITFLQLHNGRSFSNPRLVPRESKKVFGIEIEEGEDKGSVFIIEIDQVETAY